MTDECPFWKDASNLKSDFRDQIKGNYYCSRPTPAPAAPELTVGMVSAYEQGFKEGRSQTLDDVRKELREEYCAVTEGVDWDSIVAVLIRLRNKEHER